MSQVSKRYIPENKLHKILDLFLNLILSVSDKKEAESLLNELLTPTEKVMLIKRLACFYLLLKKVSFEEINDNIKISTSTIAYLKHYIENSFFLKRYLLEQLKNKKFKNLLKDIFVEIYFGMPRKGRNWSEDKRTYYKHKREMQDPLN